MTVPTQADPSAPATSSSSLVRAAIWVAIGALIAAAIVCVVWVFVGAQNGIIGRAFLTILLLAAFAGVAILDAHLAPRRPAWFALASMGGWIALLLIGAVMIWLPERSFWSSGFARFVQFLLIVLIVQLALLHLRLYLKASQRWVTAFTRIVSIVTIVLVVALVVLLVFPLMLGEWVVFTDLYWRIVVAVTILAAVGTAIVPLVNVLFAPRTPRPAAPAYPSAPLAAGVPAPAWPTYVDGVTPLPVMPDGTPDWGAYYTGYVSPGAQVVGMPAQTWPQDAAASAPAPAPAPAPAQPGFEQGYPPASPQPAPAPGAPVPPYAAPGPQQPAAGQGYDGYPPPPPLPPRA